MKYLHVAAAALCCVALPAQAMTVTEFLTKVRGLEAQGIGALFSSDIGLLKGEMKGITTTYAADIKAARAAGRRPHSCPPAKGKTDFGRKEFIAELEKIPAAQRGMSMKTAFYAIMQRRFPCT